jgi:hypothetical protein
LKFCEGSENEKMIQPLEIPNSTQERTQKIKEIPSETPIEVNIDISKTNNLKNFESPKKFFTISEFPHNETIKPLDTKSNIVNGLTKNVSSDKNTHQTPTDFVTESINLLSRIIEAGVLNPELQEYCSELITVFLDYVLNFLPTNDGKIKFLEVLNEAMISRFQKFKSILGSNDQKSSKILNDFVLYLRRVLKVIVEKLYTPGTIDQVFKLLKDFIIVFIKRPTENEPPRYFNRASVFELMKTVSSKLKPEEKGFYNEYSLLLTVYSGNDVSTDIKTNFINYFSTKKESIDISNIKMQFDLTCYCLENSDKKPSLEDIEKFAYILFNRVPHETKKFSQFSDGYENHSNLEKKKITQNNGIETLENTIADKRDKKNLNDPRSFLESIDQKKLEEMKKLLVGFIKFMTMNERDESYSNPNSLLLNEGSIGSKENKNNKALLQIIAALEAEFNKKDSDFGEVQRIFQEIREYIMPTSQKKNILI